MEFTDSYSEINSEHGETALISEPVDRTNLIIITAGGVVSSAIWAGSIAYTFGRRSRRRRDED